jgi:hypothetical protein
LHLTKEIDEIIYKIFEVLEKPIDKKAYEVIDRGIPHQPKSLPLGMMGVYIFLYGSRFLKIGKAGPRSNARFLSQHYNPKSARSTLAASILLDKEMHGKGILEENVGEWIKTNCRRIDILLNTNLGIFALEVIEAALHHKYEPIYEGFASQRR